MPRVNVLIRDLIRALSEAPGRTQTLGTRTQDTIARGLPVLGSDQVERLLGPNAPANETDQELCPL